MHVMGLGVEGSSMWCDTASGAGNSHTFFPIFPLAARAGAGSTLGCHAERSAALQVTRAPGRTTERGTCWTEAVLEGVHSLSRIKAGTKDTECVYVSVCLSM